MIRRFADYERVVVEHFDIAPQTARRVRSKCADDARFGRLGHVDERRQIDGADNGVLASRLRICPSPNVVAVAGRAHAIERHESEQVDVAALVLAAASVLARLISYRRFGGGALVLMNAFGVQELLQSHHLFGSRVRRCVAGEI